MPFHAHLRAMHSKVALSTYLPKSKFSAGSQAVTSSIIIRHASNTVKGPRFWQAHANSSSELPFSLDRAAPSEAAAQDLALAPVMLESRMQEQLKTFTTISKSMLPNVDHYSKVPLELLSADHSDKAKSRDLLTLTVPSEFETGAKTNTEPDALYQASSRQDRPPPGVNTNWEGDHDPYPTKPMGLEVAFKEDKHAGVADQAYAQADDLSLHVKPPSTNWEGDHDPYHTEPTGLELAYQQEKAANELGQAPSLADDYKNMHKAYDAQPDDGYEVMPTGMQTSFAQERVQSQVSGSPSLEHELKQVRTAAQEAQRGVGSTFDDEYASGPMGIETSFKAEALNGDVLIGGKSRLEHELSLQQQAYLEAQRGRGNAHEDEYPDVPSGLETSFGQEQSSSIDGRSSLESELSQMAKEAKEAQAGLGTMHEDEFPATPSGLETSFHAETRDSQSGNRLGLEQELRKGYVSGNPYNSQGKTCIPRDDIYYSDFVQYPNPAQVAQGKGRNSESAPVTPPEHAADDQTNDDGTSIIIWASPARYLVLFDNGEQVISHSLAPNLDDTEHTLTIVHDFSQFYLSEHLLDAFAAIRANGGYAAVSIRKHMIVCRQLAPNLSTLAQASVKDQQARDKTIDARTGSRGFDAGDERAPPDDDEQRAARDAAERKRLQKDPVMWTVLFLGAIISVELNIRHYNDVMRANEEAIAKQKDL